MFFVTILIKNTACRITPIYRLEAGSGGAGGGGAGGGEPGGGGAGGGGAGGSYLSATYRKPLFISNLHKALIYQQLTKSDFYSIFGTKN